RLVSDERLGLRVESVYLDERP
ncbi:hypothetical protein Tco_0494600, partial [Tanacetum coccineum]